LLFILILISTLVAGTVSWVIGVIDDARTTRQFNLLSPAEHLAQARAACGGGNECLNIQEALRHLARIPTSVPENTDATRLRTEIDKQEAQAYASVKQEVDAARDISWEQAQRNFQGQSDDSFKCSTDAENHDIVSFDDGHFWWKDDGRCATREGQRKRDQDAQLHSYWSTTIRVDTDMNSSWLPDEERTCQTYPDDKGRVATVTCEATPHETHNIPVQFWGGVDRNTVSSWKCRRDKDVLDDRFVCKAID
jgi:hypothetical protein